MQKNDYNFKTVHYFEKTCSLKIVSNAQTYTNPSKKCRFLKSKIYIANSIFRKYLNNKETTRFLENVLFKNCSDYIVPKPTRLSKKKKLPLYLYNCAFNTLYRTTFRTEIHRNHPDWISQVSAYKRRLSRQVCATCLEHLFPRHRIRDDKKESLIKRFV